MKKQIISIGLATSMLMGGMALAAGTEKSEVEVLDNEVILISSGTEISPEKEAKSNYTSYKGKITEITREPGVLTITVNSEDKDSSFKAMKFTVTKEALVLTDKTQGDIERRNVVEGMTVEMFYGNDSPMTMSLPPMTNASLLVVRESKEEQPLAIKVDTFNKIAEENNSLVSVDNALRLNITDKTVIVDKDGEKVEEKDLAGKGLVVFYGPATTMSIPAQSNAVKIIVVGEQEKAEEVPSKPEVPETPQKPEVTVAEIKTLDKFGINGEKINLKNKIYKSGETFMMPIREVAEKLGYEVKWNGKTKQAELTKDSNFITATANKNDYSFAKMIVKLEKASESEAGTMFVPVSFIEEVMKLEMKVTKEGIVNIKTK